MLQDGRRETSENSTVPSAGKEKPSPSFAESIAGVRPLAPGPPTAPDPRRRPATRTPAPDAEPTPTFEFPEPGEPLLARAPGTAQRILDRLASGRIPPELRIDLHGLRAEAAERALGRALESAHRARLTCLLVVHGRGKRSPAGPVLRESLPGWLTSEPNARRVRAFAPARAPDGGPGATYVLLH